MLGFLEKITKKGRGIWKYADFYAAKIAPENRLFLGDGGTPLIEDRPLAAELGVGRLFFKREDLNATGSLKGRSLCYQVSLAKERGARGIVISTSGNAGIAAAAYARQAGLKAFVFISPDTEEAKVADMLAEGPTVIRSARAMRMANYAAAKYGLPNLRPSLDDDSIEGFKSIGFEINDEADAIDAVFTYVTSGSSFIGMYRAFAKRFSAGELKSMPRMYAVQSGRVHSIAEEFEENACLIAEDAQRGELTAGVRAGQLGARHTRRKKEIVDIIRETGGRGLYVTEREIARARGLLEGRGLVTSLEGCASLAGLLRVREKVGSGRAVVVFSGKKRDADGRLDESRMLRAETFEEVDRIMESNIYSHGVSLLSS